MKKLIGALKSTNITVGKEYNIIRVYHTGGVNWVTYYADDEKWREAPLCYFKPVE